MEYEVINGDGGDVRVQCITEGAQHAFVQVARIKPDGDGKATVIPCEEEYDRDARCSRFATHIVTICDAPELAEGSALGPDRYVLCKRHAAEHLMRFL